MQICDTIEHGKDKMSESIQTEEKLYEDIPPTKRRNRKEVFRKPANKRFWTWLADFVLFRMLSHRFYALRVKNRAFVQNRNKNYPVIIYAPHANWWDGIVGYTVMRTCFTGLRTRMMIEEMNRFPLFGKIGAFPINKKSAQEAMKSLKFIVDDMKDPDMCFWIFPQGIIKPPNHRPFEFQTGLAYVIQNIAKKHGGVNLFPLAVNYTFLREDRPEVLVEIGEPIVVDRSHAEFDRHEYTKWLAEGFTKLCDSQFKDISNGEVTGYEYVFKQRLPWNRQIEKKLKNIGMDKAEN